MGFQAESAGISKMDSKIKLFVKFGEHKHIKRLFGGKMYFSNAMKFREIEKNNGLKGQGDAFEAILPFKNSNAFMKDPETGQSFSRLNTTVFMGFADVANIPVFCITGISEEDYTLKESHGKRILIVSNTVRDTIKAHFPKADTAGVFFQPKLFIDSFNRLGTVYHGEVEYFDFSPEGVIKEMMEYIAQYPGIRSEKNQLLASIHMKTNEGEEQRLKITEQNKKRILFCKDYYFNGEKEYRILLPKKRISMPKEYTIRWGKQLKKMYPVDEFFNGVEL